MEKDYYLLFVWGCVEPELDGPYNTSEERDNIAFDKRKRGSLK